MLFDQIAVTTDFSSNSYQAFDIAVYLSKSFNAQLHLCFVLSASDVGDKQSALKKLEELKKTAFHRTELKCHVLEEDRNPEDLLEEFCEAEAVGLLLFSSNGQGENSQVGSTALALLDKLSVPTMMIPVHRLGS